MNDICRATLTASTLTAADSDDEKTGKVRALVSAYGTRYQIGFARYHTIEADAFAESIKAQASIPLFWQHAWDWSEQPPIGHADASETADGLEIDGEMYLDQSGVPAIHRALVAGALREWSIGYRILVERADPDDDLHRFIEEAELLEASVVLRGANPQTKTLEVASSPWYPSPDPGTLSAATGDGWSMTTTYTNTKQSGFPGTQSEDSDDDDGAGIDPALLDRGWVRDLRRESLSS
ncbi:MAG: hypothetical protein GY716_02345 [bacterium]|nr:hypothetical protein [bacterium]